MTIIIYIVGEREVDRQLDRWTDSPSYPLCNNVPWRSLILHIAPEGVIAFFGGGDGGNLIVTYLL